MVKVPSHMSLGFYGETQTTSNVLGALPALLMTVPSPQPSTLPHPGTGVISFMHCDIPKCSNAECSKWEQRNLFPLQMAGLCHSTWSTYHSFL